jgi:hypothetical protein
MDRPRAEGDREAMTSAFMQTLPGEVTIHAPQEFYAGDDWIIAATCTDGDGNPIDLSLADVIWRLNDGNGVNVLELSEGDGIVLIENVSGDLIIGQCQIEVSSSRTVGLIPAFYSDELTVIDGNGRVSTQFSGRIEVLAKLPGPVSGSTSGG